MTGGACEASVYCRAGLDATCLCLALGNYHNMGHLDEVQAGTWDRAARGPARCAHEFISVADWGGLVRLLTALGTHGVRIEGSAFAKRLEALYDERKFVLEQRA